MTTYALSVGRQVFTLEKYETAGELSEAFGDLYARSQTIGVLQEKIERLTASDDIDDGYSDKLTSLNKQLARESGRIHDGIVELLASRSENPTTPAEVRNRVPGLVDSDGTQELIAGVFAFFNSHIPSEETVKN